jgi:hypothetical protein
MSRVDRDYWRKRHGMLTRPGTDKLNIVATNLNVTAQDIQELTRRLAKKQAEQEAEDKEKRAEGSKE